MTASATTLDRHHLLAVFATEAAAREALAQLQRQGIAGASLQPRNAPGETAKATPADARDEGWAGVLRSLAVELLGAGADERWRPHAAALDAGGALLRLEVDASALEQAHATLREAGAIAVEDRRVEAQPAGATGTVGSAK